MRIKELRKLAGIKQVSFAKDMKVSQATVSEWESEKISPSIDNLISIARYFHVSVGCVVGEEPIPADYPNHSQIYSLLKDDPINSESERVIDIPSKPAKMKLFTGEQMEFLSDMIDEILAARISALKEDTSSSNDQGTKQG